MTKASWSHLTTFLTSEAEVSTVLSFQQIERILGHALPASAYRHAAFWSNASSYSWAWREAGREVSRHGLLPEQVCFRLRHPLSAVLSPQIEDLPLRSVPESGISPENTQATEDLGFEQDADVLLLGCVKPRATSPRHASDPYLSDLFLQRRRYADQRGLPWFVLSAEHGLLRPEDVVAPDAIDLKARPASYRRVWAAWVVERLRREMGPLTGVRLEVHAGDTSAKALGEPASAAGACMTRPLRGLRWGEQLDWYHAHSGLLFDSTSHPATGSRTQVRTGDAPERAEVDSFVATLRDVTAAIPLAQLDESHVPSGPGLYSWWVDEPGAMALTSCLGHRVTAGLIYAGQVGATLWPSGQRSSTTLRGQLIGMHRDGSVNFSTFRRTLAAGLKLGPARRADDEDVLTEWMGRHLAVTWRITNDPDGLGALERDVLARLDPALNLRSMHATEVRRELKRRRSKRGVLAAQPTAADPTDSGQV